MGPQSLSLIEAIFFFACAIVLVRQLGSAQELKEKILIKNTIPKSLVCASCSAFCRKQNFFPAEIPSNATHQLTKPPHM